MSTAVLLVGGNPLPNLLAVTTLRPDRAVLIHSQETLRPAQRLRAALDAVGVRTEVEELASAYDAAAVAGAFGRIAGRHHDLLLVYTGGTKVMAAHTRLAFASLGRPPRAAFYVDERDGLLRDDDGGARQLVPATLDLTGWAGLHGIGQLSAKPAPPVPGPTAAEAAAIAQVVADDPGTAGQLNDATKSAGGKVLPSDAALDLTPYGVSRTVPEPEWNRDLRKSWGGFLQGEWLEIWVHSLLGRPGWRVFYDVNAKFEGTNREFQVDVVALDGVRSAVLSCTTDASKYVKPKAFEVALRARQLGGDLARWCVVCLAPPALTVELQSDIASAWDPSSTPTVFGAADVGQWAYGDTAALLSWLTGDG